MLSYHIWLRAISICILSYYLLSSNVIFSQTLQDSWKIPSYQANEYADLYGRLYFSSSLQDWEEGVESVLTDAIVSWQAEANYQIDEILRKETGEDAFVTNEGYVDERRRSLFSEASVFYTEWERNLVNDYFFNKNSFLEKLETGKVDALYFQRIGQESIYESYTQEELLLHENREKILKAANEWEYQWEKTKQEGLDSFASSLEALDEDYLKYISNLQETENQFIGNLNAIDEYRQTVYTALSSMIQQMKDGIEGSCEITTGCLYRNYDGSYNEAGKIFSKLITDISEVLSSNEKDPDLLFTNVATKMRDFLADESNKAFVEQTYYKDRIYTYQTGLQINLNNSKSSFNLSEAEWFLRNQNYNQLSSDVKYENWGYIPGDVGAFAGIQDSELQSFFRSIHNADYNQLTDIINAKLGDGRRVQNLINANLYTDAFHFLNNFSIMGVGVPFEQAYHVEGNLILDGKSKYGFWQAERNLTIFTPGTFSYQMGAIGYSVLFEMYDDTSYNTSLYWDSNFSQLNQQNKSFTDKLLPAITHWESRVKEYSDSFKNWTNAREGLIEEAKLEYQKNRINLETTKENWLQKLELENENGWKSWSEFYEKGDVTTNVSNFEPLQFESNFKTIQDQGKLLEFRNESLLGNDLSEVKFGQSSLIETFQRTVIGVNQYASVVQMNHELEEFQKKEQNKLINQYVYGLNTEVIGDRKLSKEEMIIVGSADYKNLTDEEKSNFGKCYEDPTISQCSGLLKKEYVVSDPGKNGNITISKEIYNGMLGSRNQEGEYEASMSVVSKQISLSSIGKIQGVDRKDFFTEWTEEDWEALQNRKNQIADTFVTKSLKKDQNQLITNLNAIESLNENNYKKYVTKKESQENIDSFVQDMAIAYLTGGVAGVKASLKGKVESSINTEIAKVWIKATGGDENQIQLASMAIDFMRGRLSERKIKAREQYVSIKNPIQSIETVVRNTISYTIQGIDTLTNGLGSVPINLAMSGIMALTKELAGEKKYNKLNQQISGSKTRLEEIKRNEDQLIESSASISIARATGMPIETISNLVGDIRGKQKAKKADKAMSKNILSDIGTKITGAFGGILKTAVVAIGIPEDQIYSIMSDAHKFINSGNTNRNSDSINNFGYTLQTIGLQANWTKYQSSNLDLKNKNAVATDIGKTLIAKELSKAYGIDESFVRQSLDAAYGKYQKKKLEGKAQNSAIRQTVVNAASIAITMGANGVWGSAKSALSKVGKFANVLTKGVIPATARVGQVITSTILQTAAGSHEGKKGATAGLINGSLLGLTDKFGKIQSGLFKGMMPGIGVTYSEQNGWGGTVGIGNSINNVSYSLSERGNSSLQFSQAIAKGLQFVTDFTSNQSYKFGLNYNPSGEGPRNNWNFSMIYDLKGSGLSGSLGFTDPNSKLGAISNIDQNGLSHTSTLQGVNLGTNSNDGFQLEEFNFANQNINMAQDTSDITDQNGNVIENEGDSPLSDIASQIGLFGSLLLGGFGTLNLLRNRISGGSSFLQVGSDIGKMNFESNSDRSILRRFTDPIQKGLFWFGESVSRYSDSFTPEPSNQKVGNSKVPLSAKEIDRISKLKTSIIDDYKKDSRLDTEKKLYELKQAGVDTTEIEAAIKVKRGGKDVPMSKAVERSFNEYKRLRESRSVRPIGSEVVEYVSSSDALSKVNIEFDPKKESSEAYVKRLGDEICKYSQDVDLSTNELVSLHSANVAKLLGDNLMNKIKYNQSQLIDGKEDVSAVNTVDENGFRKISETDCIRYIGAVLFGAGLTEKGSFANLNSDVYLTPEEMERMASEYKAGYVHKNGVEYFRQAGSFSNLISERLTTESELKSHKAKGVIPDLKVGTIGITRKMETVEGTKRDAMKSDHIYIIIGKKFNPNLGVTEYLISESAGGKGVQNRWIRVETNARIKEIYHSKLLGENFSATEIKIKMKNFKLPNSESDYLTRSEFYELKPQSRELYESSN
ncbi:TIGR04388 family protein [Leptospira limi]|uniref:TIGR04388 family protein n=1 Tax=Leptospira limi TaxID=2950023 RepID=A0ABT3LWR9_9LEPT|nr:TIGR04388 family protein [Leptospira limi]MCW7461945.1 TIGR04388 family protein [Leptospira limi]